MPRRVMATRWAFVLALLAGCTSPSSEGPTSGAPRTIAADPITTSTYASRLEATISVANADGIVSVAGMMWVKTDDGRVVQIDPATNTVSREIQVDDVADRYQYCQGVGTDGTSVWACATRDDGTGMVRIDPATGRIVRRVKAGKIFDQVALPVTSRGVWLLTGDGASLQVVNSATGRAVAYPLADRCQQVAALGDRVVATSRLGGRVFVLDANTGGVVSTIALASPGVAVLTGEDLWVDTDAGLTRLGPDLRVRSVYPGLRAGLGGDLVASADSLWLRSTEGTITRVAADSGRVLEGITAEAPLAGGSLTRAFGSLWTTSGDDGRVLRLRLDS